MSQCRLCLKNFETIYCCDNCYKYFCEAHINTHKMCANDEEVLYNSYIVDEEWDNLEIVEYIENNFKVEDLNLRSLWAWCGYNNNNLTKKCLQILKYFLENNCEYSNGTLNVRVLLDCKNFYKKYKSDSYSSYTSDETIIIIRCSETEPRLFSFCKLSTNKKRWIRFPKELMLDCLKIEEPVNIIYEMVKLLLKSNL